MPADIDGDLADRLVNHYLDCLLRAPALHDKVEFEIVLSCYSFDLPDRLARLPDCFPAAERELLADSLRRLTNRIIDRDHGLWRSDSARIEELERRHAIIMGAGMDTVSRIYWLLEDCKRYGTLPFAGLARAGFVATQMLASLVAIGVLSSDELARFMAGLETVSSVMGRDLQTLDRSAFLTKYGHLRPGTYDILSPRYDQAPDLYFGAAQASRPASAEPFALSLKQMRNVEALLRQHGLNHTVVGLFDFFEAGIRGREHAKFVFTRSLSDALSLFTALGQEHGFSLEEISFADIGCIRQLYAGAEDAAEVLAASIAQGRKRYAITNQLILPPLISDPGQVWQFMQPPTMPNFITRNQVVGPVVPASPDGQLEGCVVLLPNADPGFDWIFSRGIAAFITAYGGVNSHMAVRANELGLPAVIGTGQPMFERLSQAKTLRIDCPNRLVQVLQ